MTAVPAQLDDWVRAKFGVQLTTTSSPVRWELTDLVGLALRRNPRRAHLLVSTVLGKHVPADPGVILGAGHLLGLLVAGDLGLAPSISDAELIGAAGSLRAGDPAAVDALVSKVDAAPDLVSVFGFAETATGLGHCVADALGAGWYVHSTRREIAGVPVTAGFEEGHSHATSHLVQPAPPDLFDRGDVLVLVDDEFSTGTTAMAAITELHRVRPRSRYVVAALIDLRSAADVASMAAFATTLGCEISVVALVTGSVELPLGLAAAASAHIEHAPDSASAAAAAVTPIRVDVAWPADLPEGGRHGFLRRDRDPFDAAVQAAGAQVLAALPAGAHRILVIGTEELMYLPLRLARLIADQPGYQARFQTTTRSPVHPEIADGYPVSRAFSFVNPEGRTDAPRYLYNADWRSPTGRLHDGSGPDAVVLVIDEPMDTPWLAAAGGLISVLGQLAVPVVLAVVAGAQPAALVAGR